MDAGLAGSENDLFLSRPGSNQEGCFPRAALVGDERVLFEARPRLLARHRRIIFASLPFVIFFGLVLAVAVAQFGPNPAALGLFVFLEFLTLIPILYAISSWRATSYALTNKRVLVRAGDDYHTATLDQVREVSVKPGSDTVLFDIVRGYSPGTGQAQIEQMVWSGTPGAPGVAVFAQRAALFYQIRMKQQRLRDEFVASSMSQRIVCDYCRGLVDLSRVNPADPRCPRCNAPITAGPR